MEIYVVESNHPVLEHPGGQSQGVPAVGWTGEGTLYLHMLVVTDVPPDLVEIDQVFHRFGPSEGHWWVSEGQGALAHWPGVSALRARCVQRRLVSMRALLEEACRPDTSTSAGHQASRPTTSRQTASAGGTRAPSSTPAGKDKKSNASARDSATSATSATSAASTPKSTGASSKATPTKGGASASKSASKPESKSASKSSGKSSPSKAGAAPTAAPKSAGAGSSSKPSQKSAASTSSNGASSAAPARNGTAHRASSARSAGSSKAGTKKPS